MQPFNSNYLPRLKSFADVEYLYNNVKHCGKDASNERRLGDLRGHPTKQSVTGFSKEDIKRGRGHKTKLLAKKSDSEYHAVLYDSSLIKFYKDHYTISLRGWDSRSTIAFIDVIADLPLIPYNPYDDIPYGYLTYSAHKHKKINEYALENMKMMRNEDIDLTLNHVPLSLACRELRIGGKVYLINEDESYDFTYDNRPVNQSQFMPHYKYRVNRGRLLAKRKEIQPLINFVGTTFKLQSHNGGDTLKGMLESLGDGVESTELYKKESEDLDKLYKFINNPHAYSSDDYYGLYMTLISNNRKNTWNKDTWWVKLDDVLKHINSILRCCNADTLDRVKEG